MGRFERVTSILDEAVGGPEASFANHGPFWREKTRDQFVALRVRGKVLLVVGDGAGSNLVKALRGQEPFNEESADPPPPGAELPRMPVGLDAVSAPDIDFIQTWIDDGCPEDDEPAASGFAWRPTNAPPTQRYDDIWFATPELGWAVNSDGKIFQTRDGGTSWQQQFQVPVEASDVYLRSIGFASETRGWVGTIAGEIRLYETSDGATWTPVAGLPADAPEKVCGISVVNESIVYASGTNEPRDTPRIMKTTDGGRTWQARDMTDHASVLIDNYFTGPDTGWVVGGRIQPVTEADLPRQCTKNLARSKLKPVVLRTEDGGATWTDRLAGMESRFPHGEWGWKIFFVNDEIGYVALENFCEGAVLKTTDGGQTWIRLPINDEEKNANLEGIGFVDENHGWVGGWGKGGFPGDGLSSETTNGGQNWSHTDWSEPTTGDPQPRGEYLNRFRFLGDPVIVGYASGNTVYKYSTEPVAPAPPSAAAAAAPGLFSEPGPVTTGRPARLALTVPDGAAELRVDVWDRFGAHVRQLVRESAPTSGERIVTWNVDSVDGDPLDPGYYIVRATTDDRSESTMLWISN